MNAAGQVVLSESLTVSSGAYAHALETADLPAGYYICQLRLGKEVMRRALVRQ